MYCQKFPPECRLAICLYRLGRGGYITFIQQQNYLDLVFQLYMVLLMKFLEQLLKICWQTSVLDHFPTNVPQFTEKMLDMEQLWQFPYSWGAIDGCHISIQCPADGQEAMKEYHNFKNFYSIVMMAIIDAQDRFIWTSIGFPGNSHDAIILQSTQLWHDVTENNIIPSMGKRVEGTFVYPMMLGDSAFSIQEMADETIWQCHSEPKRE